MYLSLALSYREAFHLVGLYKEDVFANSDKEIREFRNIVNFLYETKDRNRFDPVKARHAFFHHRDGCETRLIALSPSNTSVTQAISKFVELKPQEGSERFRNVVREGENFNAVALHFTFGDFSAVLGSDLEETGNKQSGWSAVFQSNIISDLSLSTSSLFKVSHHGSKTGHHDNILSDLLVKNPLSITTPFTRSHLPTPENIDRIKAYSSEFLVTRDPKSGKKIKRENMVDREMKAIVKERRTVNDKMGHIQIRVSDKGDLNVAANHQCVRYSL